MSPGEGFRWIDFRVRPPFKSFVPSFYRFTGPLPPKAPDQPPMPAIMRSVFRDPLPSRDERSFDLFLRDMQEAHVAIAVVTGRQDPATLAAEASPEDGVLNADVVDLVRTDPDRFVGIGGVDTTDPRAALEAIRGFKDLGLIGVALDNGQCSPPRANDDGALDPIYEYCDREGMLLSLNGSFVLAPDLSYIEPVQIQRVALRFPGLKILVAHACWPWVTPMCAVALQCPNVHLMPDLYPGLPGQEGYFEAMRFGIEDQMLFATSYPAMSLQSAAEVVRGLAPPDDREFHERMFANAARLIGRDVTPAAS
ncbi:MAG: amidohydrolase family protein [Deltaproteobacteria bacterium]|nr:amidohydrolase family protein [Deltaproteobacteria bacterium]